MVTLGPEYPGPSTGRVSAGDNRSYKAAGVVQFHDGPLKGGPMYIWIHINCGHVVRTIDGGIYWNANTSWGRQFISLKKPPLRAIKLRDECLAVLIETSGLIIIREMEEKNYGHKCPIRAPMLDLMFSGDNKLLITGEITTPFDKFVGWEQVCDQPQKGGR